MHRSHAGQARPLRAQTDRPARADDRHHTDRFCPSVSGDRGRSLRCRHARLAGGLSAAGSPLPPAGTLSGGGRRAPGSGGADGGAVRETGGVLSAPGPGFDETASAGGYRWWYVDALSDDGQFGVTLIALIGSVFSPYYAHARRRGGAVAESHCALNAVFYGPGTKHWAMTERGASDLIQQPDSLQIGPSSLRWVDGSLVADIREITVPWPRRLAGTVTLHPECHQPRQFALDGNHRHHWWPAAPVARVEVAMDSPGLHWQGSGYLDSNWGEEPLEDCFSYWNWSRAHLRDGSSVLLYEPHQVNGDSRRLAYRFDPQGDCEPVATGPVTQLPHTTIWRIARETRGDAGSAPAVLKTFEDTPFYSRSLLATELLGESTVAVHESLSLTRFDRRWVQCLLPFRMPRRAG